MHRFAIGLKRGDDDRSQGLKKHDAVWLAASYNAFARRMKVRGHLPSVLRAAV